MATARPVAAERDLASFRSLPVEADEGFPQSFLLGMAGRTYRFEFHVNVAEQELPRYPADLRAPIDLVGDGPPSAAPRGLLVAAIHRLDPDAEATILRRRLLPGLVYRAGDLRLVVDTARIAIGNLNGAGGFGSVLEARVASA